MNNELPGLLALTHTVTPSAAPNVLCSFLNEQDLNALRCCCRHLVSWSLLSKPLRTKEIWQTPSNATPLEFWRVEVETTLHLVLSESDSYDGATQSRRTKRRPRRPSRVQVKLLADSLWLVAAGGRPALLLDQCFPTLTQRQALSFVERLGVANWLCVIELGPDDLSNTLFANRMSLESALRNHTTSSAHAVLIDVSNNVTCMVEAHDSRRIAYHSNITQVLSLVILQHKSLLVRLTLRPSPALIGCLLGYPAVYFNNSRIVFPGSDGDYQESPKQSSVNSLCGEELLHVAVSKHQRKKEGQFEHDVKNRGQKWQPERHRATELAARVDTLCSFTVPMSLFENNLQVKGAVLAYMRSMCRCGVIAGMQLTTVCSNVTLDHVAL